MDLEREHQEELAAVEVSMKNEVEEEPLQLMEWSETPLSVPQWIRDTIMELDAPLSELLAKGGFEPEKLDEILSFWLEHVENAQRAISMYQIRREYMHVDYFGILVADLVEDGRIAEVLMFCDAIDKARRGF